MPGQPYRYYPFEDIKCRNLEEKLLTKLSSSYDNPMKTLMLKGSLIELFLSCLSIFKMFTRTTHIFVMLSFNIQRMRLYQHDAHMPTDRSLYHLCYHLKFIIISIISIDQETITINLFQLHLNLKTLRVFFSSSQPLFMHLQKIYIRNYRNKKMLLKKYYAY